MVIRNNKKQKLTALLTKRDLEGILHWARSGRGALRGLNGCLFSEDPLLRWRAIEALGRVSAARAQSDLAQVRDHVRRLLWSMNDESGATAWHAPEALGEILAQVPVLAGEYTRLVAAFFKESPFERGAYWAVARIAQANPGAVQEIVEELVPALDAPDPFIRAFAYLALAAAGRLKDAPASSLRAFERDGNSIDWYDFRSGEMKEAALREIAKGSFA